MYLTVLVLHIVVCLVMVSLILLQHGKGADAGVAFGGGNTGGQSHNIGMTKVIGLLAVSFFMTSLALGFLSGHNQNVVRIENQPVETQTSEKTHNTPQ